MYDVCRPYSSSLPGICAAANCQAVFHTLIVSQDATWVTSSNSIKCTNADEVLLLLKSSDRIAHDICNAFDSCRDQPQQNVPYVLVLKKYYDLKPEREFRCFVQGHDLIGMSCVCTHTAV